MNDNVALDQSGRPMFRRAAPVDAEPSDRDRCPRCGVDLRDERDGRTYSHVMGVEVRGVYDGVLYWQCPKCSGRWHRFSEDHRLWARADVYVARRASSEADR